MMVRVAPFTLEKGLADITSVNSKKETVTVRTLGTLDNKDVVGYEDMAKEDVVLYVQYGGRTYLEKPEVVTGEMEHFNVAARSTRPMSWRPTPAPRSSSST